MPDTRIRYKIFGSPANPCLGIHFHENTPTTFTNAKAFPIIVVDDPGSANALADPGGDFIKLFDMHYAVFEAKQTDMSRYGSYLNHELGHILGLCHAWSLAYSSCPDIDPEDECGNEEATLLSDCETSVGCVYNYSNNIMNYGDAQSGIVQSQWAQMYGRLMQGSLYVEYDPYDESLPFVEMQTECITYPPSSPIEVSSGTSQTWDSPRFIDTDVEVKANANLTIECSVFMAKDKKIIVNRGGRLIVNGATISSSGPGCRWGGILVHGKFDVSQPSTTDAQNVSYSLSSSDAGVVWLKDSYIRQAVIGISTKGSGSLSGKEYFGGLVMVDNTDFIDCARAIEFMRYDIHNNSYVDISTIASSNHMDGDQGITIWGCKDISFEGVQFVNTMSFGIFQINSNSNIDNCYFDGIAAFSGDAIRTETTAPNTVTGKTIVNNCTFERYNRNLSILSTPSFINGLEITSNNFNVHSGGISSGIIIRGEAYFNISDHNSFYTKFIPVYISNTGSHQNYINCNSFGNFGYSALVFNGINSKTQFVSNNFYSTQSRSVYLDPNNGSTVIIAKRIGDLYSGADNCFDGETDGAIFANVNETESFTYHVHNLSSSPEECYVPEDNLSDSGDNNYYLTPAIEDGLNCYSSPSPPSYSLTDITTARTNTASTKSAYESSPTPSNYNSYLDAVNHQDSVLLYLVQQYSSIDDLDKVDSLLLGENSKTHLRAVVGLRTQRGDFSGAEDILDTMSIITQDDDWFKDVMELNFKIQQSDTLYKLTQSELDTMNAIVESDTSLMHGYACAILSLCAESSCPLTLDSLDEFRQIPAVPLTSEMGEDSVFVSQDLVKSNNEEIGDDRQSFLKVYPNPSKGDIFIEYHLMKGDGRIYVYDAVGRRVDQFRVSHGPGSNRIILDHSGIYFSGHG